MIEKKLKFKKLLPSSANIFVLAIYGHGIYDK